MKKVISLITALCICLTMMSSLFLISWADSSPVKTYNIDVTQTPSFSYTGGNSPTASATVVDDALQIKVSFYDRQLINGAVDFPQNTNKWAPQYHLKYGGTLIPASVGDKVIVNVSYKVTGIVSQDKGIQIGLCPSKDGNNNSTYYFYGANKHLAGDIGKEFTLSSCYDVLTANAKYANIAFTGGGTLEITALNISILPNADVNDYCVLKVNDDGKTNWSFVKKGGALPEVQKRGYVFAGYFPNSDLSGDEITSISADTVVYPKWSDDPVKTVVVDVTDKALASGFSNSGNSPSKAEVDTEKNVLKITADYRSTYFSGLYENTGSKIWMPQYHLVKKSDIVTGHPNANPVGGKVIVNVKYKVTAIKTSSEGIQIGINPSKDGDNNQVLHKNAAQVTHKDEAIGKEFTLSAVYSVTNDYYRYPNIVFAGGGTVEISQITYSVVPAENVNDYAVLKVTEGDIGNWLFERKNRPLNPPENKGYVFEGYYKNADFSGEKVTSITEDTVVYPKWSSPLRTYDIDLSQNPSDCLYAYDTCTAYTEGNKLSVKVNNNKTINGENARSWLSNYGLRSEGKSIELQTNEKVAVNIIYKVTDFSSNLTVGIGGWDSIKSSPIFVKAKNVHTAADTGKEFSLSAVFSNVQTDSIFIKHIKIGFNGIGSVDISKITVSVLNPAGFSDYCTLTTVDDNISKSEFVVKGSKLPELKKSKYIFEGWYSNKELSGSPLETVSSDCTVYAGWQADDGKIEITYVDALNGTNEKKKYDDGDKIDVKPTHKDYNFLGWYKYEDYLGKPVTAVMEGMRKLYAKWELKNNPDSLYVDLSQTPQFNFTVKTQEAGTQASVNQDNHLVVDVHNYERQLSGTSPDTMTWFPNYTFKDSSGNFIALKKDTTYNLEVTYKLVSVRGGTGTGVQVGFGVDYQYQVNRCYMKGYKMTDVKADVGKEFVYSVTYKVDSNIYPRLMFSGDGIVEITQIRISEAVPMVKDTVIGVQDYESFNVGNDTGVIGDKKGTTVANKYNHTTQGKKSLQLQIATDMARLSGNTVISLKQNGRMAPYQVENGSAYKITFYITSDIDMNNVVWNIGTAADTLLSDYLRYYTLETRGKIDIKAGKWQKVVAYISCVKGSGVPSNFFDISIASNAYDGKNVYIDDVEVMQLLDSELIAYDTVGGESLTPSRAFAEQPIITLKEASRADYLFDGWYYDKEYKKEAKLGDIFPKGKDEIVLYAKWIKPNTQAIDYNAGSFDIDIYPDKKVPYTNKMENIDSEIYFEGSSTMTRDAVWMSDAGICGNGTSETDGAICLSNEFFSYRDDVRGYNAVRLMNADGTPFTVVKGGRYTLSLDYVCASSRAVAFLVPMISEQSAYGDFGYSTEQRLNRISVQATDSDYQTNVQSFVADKTGYVYILLTGRDDNSHAEQHCYERVCIDNVKINVNEDVVKLDYISGGELLKTFYGVKGEKVIAPNLLSPSANSATAMGVYTDKEYTKEFDGFFPEEDGTCYVALKDVKYDTPSDFTKPISLSFEEKDLLKYFYNQSKFMTSWSRESANEWIWVTDDDKNALSGNSYIQLNGFGHYWNEAKFAFYDPSNPNKAMILAKGQKYRVSVMVRCIDPYEVPNGMYICLENPSERFLLQSNGRFKLEYDPKGDKNGFYRFVGDIEVSEDMKYLPTLAIRRAANDLQGLYLDDVTVEQLKNCKVSYDANGGSAIDPIEVQIHDFAIDPGVPYREGFEFKGWFTTPSFNKAWNFDTDTVEGDMTLYASWAVDNGEDEKPAEDNNKDGSNEDDGVKPVKADNGKSPELLDADKVVLEKENVEADNTDTAEESGLPVWAIILIAVGAAVVLAAGIILVIAFARKKAKK